MAQPVVTCGADQIKAFSGSAQLISLTATATNGPITAWEWTLLSVPEGSTANVGANNDFTDGVATVQNPQIQIDGDIWGTYVFQAKATNSAAETSDPLEDAESAQTAIIVQSINQDEMPNDYLYDWGKRYLNPLLRTLVDQNLLAKGALSLWVDADAGSDLNSGFDSSHALESFSALQKILPKESAYNVVINVRGTFATKQYLTSPKLINEAHLLVDGGSAVSEVLASTAATSQADGSITVSAAGWTAKAYEGSFVEILTGPFAGQTRVIGESTTDTIKFTQDIAGLGIDSLVNFKIYKPATNFSNGFAVNNALNHGNAFAEVRLQRFTSDKKINIGAGTFSINNLIATDPVEEFGIETERGTHLHAINTGYYDPTTFIQDADKACSFGGTGIKVCTGGNSVLDNIFTEKRLFCRVGQVFFNNIWLRGVMELIEAFVEIDGLDHLGGIPDAAGCVFEHCHVLFKNNININSEDIGIWAENCLIDTTSTTVLAGTCTNFGARFLKGTHMTLNPSMSVPTLSGGSGDFTPNEVAAGSWSTVLAGTPYAHFGESVIVRRNSDLAPEPTGGGPGSDTTAIHDNIDGEINAIAEKTTPVGADLLLIEDSEDAPGYNKKKIQIANLPGGSSTPPISYNYTQTADNDPTLDVNHDFNSFAGAVETVDTALTGSGLVVPSKAYAKNVSMVKGANVSAAQVWLATNLNTIRARRGGTWAAEYTKPIVGNMYKYDGQLDNFWAIGNNNAFVAHNIDDAGWVPRTDFPDYNDATWDPIAVRAVSKTEVYIGASDGTNSRIYKWNGSAWVGAAHVHLESNFLVTSFCKYNGIVYAFGIKENVTRCPVLYSSDGGATWQIDDSFPLQSKEVIRIHGLEGTGGIFIGLWNYTDGFNGARYSGERNSWVLVQNAHIIGTSKIATTDRCYARDDTPGANWDIMLVGSARQTSYDPILDQYDAGFTGVSQQHVFAVDGDGIYCADGNNLKKFNYGTKTWTDTGEVAGANDLFVTSDVGSAYAEFIGQSVNFTGDAFQTKGIGYEVGANANHALKADSGDIQLKALLQAEELNLGGYGALYVKTIGGNPEIFYNSGAGEVQITSNGTVIGVDGAAIHGNVDGEINAITSKGIPVAADVLLIEDSDASYAKKKITLTDLLGGGGGTANEESDAILNSETIDANHDFILTNTPLTNANMAAGYELVVFRNGIKVEYAASLTAGNYDQYTYNNGTKTVTVLAAGEDEIVQVIYWS